MPFSIYMDVHIPFAITEGLRRRQIDVLRSQDDGTTQLDDESLLARATELGRLLFTQDEDLLKIAAPGSILEAISSAFSSPTSKERVWGDLWKTSNSSSRVPNRPR